MEGYVTTNKDDFPLFFSDFSTFISFSYIMIYSAMMNKNGRLDSLALFPILEPKTFTSNH